MKNWLIDWFQQHIDQSRVISCLEVRESHTLYLHIYIFCVVSWEVFFLPMVPSNSGPVSWDCRTHQLHLCRRVRPPLTNEFPGYDTKQSDGEVPIMLELSGMQSTPSLPSLPGSLWPGVVAPDRILSMGKIEQKGKLMLNWITWNKNVLIFKLGTYAKQNCLENNCFDM